MGTSFTKRKNKREIERALDKAWKEAVLKKYNYRCVVCGKQDRLQAHHIFSRSRRITRWDLENGICLCAGHHYQAHINPEWFRRKIIEFMGQAKYEELYQKSQITKKYSREELEQILNNLRKEGG